MENDKITIGNIPTSDVGMGVAVNIHRTVTEQRLLVDKPVKFGNVMYYNISSIVFGESDDNKVTISLLGNDDVLYSRIFVCNLTSTIQILQTRGILEIKELHYEQIGNK